MNDESKVAASNALEIGPSDRTAVRSEPSIGVGENKLNSHSPNTIHLTPAKNQPIVFFML